MSDNLAEYAERCLPDMAASEGERVRELLVELDRLRNEAGVLRTQRDDLKEKAGRNSAAVTAAEEELLRLLPANPVPSIRLGA